MQFKIIPKALPNADKFEGDDVERAKQLCEKLKEELGEFMRSFVLFGSTARGTAKVMGEDTIGNSDIDVLVIINDLSNVLTQELIETYRIIVTDAAAAISKRFHIQTQKLTTFWDGVRLGDAVMVNMLRDGVALYDMGIFVPVQHLLLQGKVRPTKEAVWGYYTRAPLAIDSAKNHLLAATYDLYWACMDASHAALMALGHTPLTPEKVPEMLDAFMVKRHILEPQFAQRMQFFYTLAKKINHREVQEIKGEEYARYVTDAEEYIDRMRKIVTLHHPPF